MPTAAIPLSSASHYLKNRQKKEVLHELGHIVDDDFGKDMQASMIEEMIRRSNIVPDKVAEDVEFYYHVV